MSIGDAIRFSAREEGYDPPSPAEMERAYGREVAEADGTVLRDEAWRAAKRAHVDRIRAFAERYPSVGMRYLSLLSDINFSRGVYARAELMSLVNDYRCPTTPDGAPSSPAWAAYAEAHERGASELELARLFYRAHNEGLARALRDPRYQAARAACEPRFRTLCDATLRAAEEIERKLQDPRADPSAIHMEGIAGFLKAHAQAGVLPIRASDVELVVRASDLNPLERLLDAVRGECDDERVMARAMCTMAEIQKDYFETRLDRVREFAGRLARRFGVG